MKQSGNYVPAAISAKRSVTPKSWQHCVEPCGENLGLRRCRLLDRRHLQHAIVDRYFE